MVTAAHLTKKLLRERPFIEEAIHEGIINIMALAEMLKPDIEEEIGPLKTSAVSMAIRRYIEEQEEKQYRKPTLELSDIRVQSNLLEISVAKSPRLPEVILALYRLVRFEDGDTLHIIQGNHEVLIITNDRNKKIFLSLLKKEKIKSAQDKMSAVSVRIPERYINAPGFYFMITRLFALADISIRDIVNTESEAIFMMKEKYTSKAYSILQREINKGLSGRLKDGLF